MIRLLVYLFPAMMDMVAGTFFFVTAVRYSESNASSLTVTGVMATWALVYSFCSIWAGKKVNQNNAAKIIIFSGFGIVLLSFCFIIFPQLDAQYLWIALMGVTTAFFFTPFQIFMKSLGHDGSSSVIRSTALYTFSWSMGMACGPFVSGYLWQFGWQWCHGLNALLGLGIAYGVWTLNKYVHQHHYSAITAKITAKEDFTKMPDLAWLGWLAAGVGCITVALVRSLFPVNAEILKLSKIDQGVVLAIVSFTQAVAGLCFIRSKTWMYRPLPVSLLTLSGVLGLLLFSIGAQPGTFYIAALLYGIYSGMFFFYLVFHSLVHPTKSSRYVSINEAIVGVASIIGPIAGGIIADKTNPSVPFTLVAILVFIVAIVQARVHYLKPVSRF